MCYPQLDCPLLYVDVRTYTVYTYMLAHFLNEHVTDSSSPGSGYVLDVSTIESSMVPPCVVVALLTIEYAM